MCSTINIYKSLFLIHRFLLHNPWFSPACINHICIWFHLPMRVPESFMLENYQQSWCRHRSPTENKHFFSPLKITFPQLSDNLILTYLYLQLYGDITDSSSPRGNVTWKKKNGSMFLIKGLNGEYPNDSEKMLTFLHFAENSTQIWITRSK